MVGKMTGWRLYRELDGGMFFCGQFATLPDAMEAAQRRPSGLHRSMWATFRAAGGARACEAPDSDDAGDWDTLVEIPIGRNYDAGYYALRVAVDAR